MSVVCPCQTNWQTGEYHDSNCPEAKKLRDSWCTPPDLTTLLPLVDLDPATNVRTTVNALRHIVWNKDPASAGWGSFGKGREHSPRFEFGDGLSIEWNGSIFLNGPYSAMLPWCQKANAEWAAKRLHGAVFLVKLDPTTRWWSELVRDREGKNLQVWLPRKRLQHVPPPRIKASTNNFASAIIHWRRPMRCDFWDLRLDTIADRWT